MKAITRYLNGMATALLLTGLTASCAYDSDEVTAAQTNSQSSFTLNVTTSPVGGETRSAYTDGIGTDAVLAAKLTGEKTVSSLVWSVFSKQDGHDGEKVWSEKWASAEPTGVYTKQEEIASNALKLNDNDVVIVAGNLSTTQNATYTAFATKTAFEQNSIGIAEALCQGGSAVDATKLPMVGTSVIRSTDVDRTQFVADVTLKHMVAKVSLNSLAVNFASTGHVNATFKPLEVFLINVPSQMTLEFDGTDYNPTGLTYTTLYQGEKAYDGTPEAKTYADYLGTGTLTGDNVQTLSSASATYTKRISLYTMPYTMADETSTATNTRLIIKGEYCADGLGYKDTNDPLDGTNGTKVMYYAVNLASATNNYNIVPNKLYKVSVTIKGPGADDAYSAIPSYQDMDVNVQCDDWEEDETTAVINGGGIKWAIDYTGIAVGDLIYADGSWSTTYNAEWAATHGDPIAIVFSTSTSEYDQSEAQNGIGNFTHGYAMALKRANSGNAVAGWCADVSSLRTTAITDVQYDNATEATQWTNITTDMNGLKHCNTAIKYCTDNSIEASNLTAIQAAKGYRPIAPLNTSGWYLPSIGQEYLWLSAFGSGWSHASTVYADRTKWTWRSDYHDFFIAGTTGATYQGASADIATAFNTYLSTTKGLTSGTHFEAFDQGHYLWSSTERTGEYPFSLTFYTYGALHLVGNAGKSYADRQVRAVLAF